MKNLIKKAFSIAADLGFRDTLRLIWVILFKWNPPLVPNKEVLGTDLLIGFEFEPHPDSWPNMVLAGVIQEYELLGIDISSIVQSGIEQATAWHCARNAAVFQGYKRVDSYEVVVQVDKANETLGRPWKKITLFAYEYHALRCKWILESKGYEVIIPEKIMLVPLNGYFKWGHQWRTRFLPLWRIWGILTRVHHILNGYIDPRVMIR